MRRIYLFFIILAIVFGSATAAGLDAPLIGPVLVAGVAAEDRLLVYDMGSLTRRDLIVRERGYQRVWGFSPDGCRLLLTVGDGETPDEIVSARLDGTDVRSLIRFTPERAGQRYEVYEPQWQPVSDGARIAFTLAIIERTSSGAERRQSRIAWIDAAGGAPIYYSAAGDEHTPRWSPDGAWLAYVGYEERVAGVDVSATAPPTPIGSSGAPMVREADLWVVSADGATKIRLTYFQTGSVSMPRWSPDGDLIGFIYSPAPNQDQVWMIGNARGAQPTQLTVERALALDLTWLPDSTAMLLTARDWRGVTQNQLWRIPLVGNADRDSALYPPDSALQYPDYPRFSPDARWLALRSAYALTLIDLNAPASVRSLDAARGNTPPVWSPAGFAGEAGCELAVGEPHP